MTTQEEPTSRSAIFSAASRLFALNGFAATPLRAIAREAGVDAALIIRHFGSKEELFLETMQLDLETDVLQSAPIEQLGERFIEFLLTPGDQVRGIYLALLRASDSAGVGSRLREAHERFFVDPLQKRLSGDDAELRSRLIAAAVGGLLYSLWVVGDEGLLADRGELIRRYGGLIQTLVTPTS